LPRNRATGPWRFPGSLLLYHTSISFAPLNFRRKQAGYFHIAIGFWQCLNLTALALCAETIES
jgi:hypothetical protein